MFRKLVFISFRLFLLILACNFFLSGQQNSLAQTSFQKCWEVSEILVSKIASDNESKIFLPLSNGIIKALDIMGKEAWKTEIGGIIVTHPQFSGRNILVLSKADSQPNKKSKEISNNLYSVSALDKDSGITIWKKEYESEQTPMISAQEKRLAVVISEKANLKGYASRLKILDEGTGSLIFERSYDFGIKQIFNAASKNQENVFMLTSLNTIAALSVSEGEITFSKTKAKNIQAGAVFDKGILLSNERGGIYLIDSNGSEHEFKIRSGAGISSITYHKNSILIASLDNFIYSISVDGKHLNWKRRFAGRITEKPIIEQDTIFAYSQGDNALYVLNQEDGKVLNRISVTNDREIIGQPILLKNFLFVATNKGIEAFGSDGCKNLAAAEK